MSDDLKTCANPEDCCRELSRVWIALGVTGPNGKSASENVAALRAQREQPSSSALDVETIRQKLLATSRTWQMFHAKDRERFLHTELDALILAAESQGFARGRAEQEQEIAELRLKLRIYENGVHVNQPLVDDIDRWRVEAEQAIDAAESQLTQQAITIREQDAEIEKLKAQRSELDQLRVDAIAAKCRAEQRLAVAQGRAQQKEPE